jgi:uncharacterized protein (DUF2252 family)
VTGDDRARFIVDCLVQAFSEPMEADPDAFRTKFRKMAADPFAFYRVEQLGAAVAKVHCVSDTDSDQSLVDFQTEEAIVEVIGADIDDFATDMVTFGLEYAAVVRDDHRRFVDAFREGRIPGITST